MSVIIKSYEALAPMLAAQLCRGVRTNAFGGRETYEKEIAAGTLSVIPWDGGLLLLRDRGTFQRLNFYMRELSFPELPSDLPVVTEIACRPRDGAMEETAEFLKTRGFLPVLERRRMQRPAGVPGEESTCPLPVCRPEREKDGSIAGLLKNCFDAVTGCLPTEQELEESLAERQIACLWQNGAVGLLHWQPGKGGTELRHLAVREEFRRQGGAKKLLLTYLNATDNKKSTVWVRKGNTPAEEFYEHNGYAADGWTSTVLLRPGKAE